MVTSNIWANETEYLSVVFLPILPIQHKYSLGNSNIAYKQQQAVISSTEGTF